MNRCSFARLKSQYRHVLDRSRIVQYVKACRCLGGGYCFYRLDEPNAADTYYALYSLSLLGEALDDEESAAFLLDLQKPDGAYPSPFAGLCAIRALRLLDKRERYDPSTYVASIALPLDPEGLPVEEYSLFEPLHTWIALHSITGIPLDPSAKRRVRELVFRYKNEDGGFGHPRSSLKETWQALEILEMIGCKPDISGLKIFLRSCEDPEFGYLGTQGRKPAYLEDMHAALYLAALLGAEPAYAESCLSFLNRCIHHSGGFVRSVYGGIPTLEFTALALESLSLLDGMGASAARTGSKTDGENS